jgi:signal peptidase I
MSAGENRTSKPATTGWPIVAAIALGVSFIIALVAFKSFAFQRFNIPSESMTPTLQAGDHLVVSKYAYGYTRYSLPFSVPLFSGRIFASEPKRGDVVVYRRPKDDGDDYIARIVGLPGDRIRMIKGQLHINGAPVQRERVQDFTMRQDGRVERVKRWRETLPNAVSHEALDMVENGFYDDTQEYRVPAGHYFMMGDNRDNALDSRVLSQVGYIPFDNLVGRAAFIYLSMTTDPQTGQRTPSFERFGAIR